MVWRSSNTASTGLCIGSIYWIAVLFFRKKTPANSTRNSTAKTFRRLKASRAYPFIGMRRFRFRVFPIHRSLARIREGRTVKMHIRLTSTPLASTKPISAPSPKLMNAMQSSPAKVVSELPATAGNAAAIAAFIAAGLSAFFSFSCVYRFSRMME